MALWEVEQAGILSARLLPLLLLRTEPQQSV